tara:strand:+ start:1576 stop:1800 length:225 start_codon:yes stop_codon:yes gene_type:complete
MNVDKAVFLFAGCMILGSLALSQLHHPGWLWLTAFAGANMIQASFTGFCPAAMVFKQLGLEGGCAFKGQALVKG